MNFNELNLHPKILKALTAAGYLKPTEVQCKVIPKIMNGFNIRASAQTGTGKTAAFLVPIFNRLLTVSSKEGKGPRALILVPTRELAQQIALQAEKYSKYMQYIKTVCVYGGVPYHTQIRKLSRSCDVLIATPGRLIDLIDRRKVNFSRLEILVLDEADRMLDMGFTEPVKQIVSLTPPTRQTLLFSATLQENIMKISEHLMNKPIDIIVHEKYSKHENIDQKLHYVDDLHHKNRLLDHILKDDRVLKTIIFTSTKQHANKLVGELYKKGHQTAALHGDMNQRQRSQAIMRLKTGKINILVATDVAARGIDVQSISHVINFDLPHNVEDYVHRIGRTGRCGEKGTALSFAARRDASAVKKIEKFTGQSIHIEEIAGFEPQAKFRPLSIKRPPRHQPRGRKKFHMKSKFKKKASFKSHH